MTTSKMPVLFQAHGAPPLLDDAQWVRELAEWGAALPRPRAIGRGRARRGRDVPDHRLLVGRGD